MAFSYVWHWYTGRQDVWVLVSVAHKPPESMFGYGDLQSGLDELDVFVKH